MPHADLVFTGGPVFTANTVRSRARSVAVKDGRIVAVGGDEIGDLVGPSTEIVDVHGRMLIPGFQDAHVHPVWGGLDMLRCDLAELATAPEYLDAIGRYVAERPAEEWILGGGWQMSAFPGGTPTAEALDAVTGDRPAFFPNRDGHGAWVNSAALRRAGIDRHTPDPADGRIERDADGRPSGTLHEGAMALVNRLLPEEPLERLTEALLVGQRYLHSFGITAWQDAIVGSYGDAGDPGPAYLAAAADGRLTARVVGAIWWDRTAGLEQIPSILERRERYRGGRFAATSVKVMQDGVAENFTASMLEPYCDGHGHFTDNSGISFVAPETLNEAVPILDAEGFQVHFHAIGDRAVRECLDAVEQAIARNGRRDNRHHIAHIQVVHPEDIARFRELGVAANMQSLWATYEPQMVDLTLPFLGEPRSAWQYPFGDLLRAGAVLAAGSDWSVSTPDPMAAIHTAVNRKAAPGHEEGEYDAFLPEQAIDLATSLTAYTAGSAWVNHLDDTTGTIEVGKLADLALLDRDPFAGPADQIGATRVLQTFVEGERVYAAPDA
ncbi:amidohydrolase family protein [Microbacterium sp. CFH 90308]|uniref:Amidohydrolase family protein n=1 Tax=Microbacterium salsuginis TaxID=2722803 RepID=A0ABX1KBP5_9MICO|nr:amidohydrolase [Microbacterium sp. CFH 90308]NLP84452.1 amidohydrolase family protein [Microbacterium sp. CFH 90308]